MKKSFIWKDAVFSQYPRPSLEPAYNSDQPKLRDITVMGYSMRMQYLRYTEWLTFDNKNFVANWSQVLAIELYLDKHENYNLGGYPFFKPLIKWLSRTLRKGWRGALRL